LPFDRIDFIKDSRAIEFDVEKVRWTCDLANYACAKAAASGESAEGESLSPDGRWATFVKDHNLYVKPVAGGAEVQLTADGEPYNDYGSEAEQSTSAVTDRLSGKKQPPVLLWSPIPRGFSPTGLISARSNLYLLQSVPPQGAALFSTPIATRWSPTGTCRWPSHGLRYRTKKKIALSGRPLSCLLRLSGLP
jgi:hypothetical protein